MSKVTGKQVWGCSLGYLAVFLIWISKVHAQSPAPLHGWWHVQMKHKSEKSWLLEADATYRVHSIHFEPQTASARAGFGRQWRDFSLTVGAALFETWPQNPVANGTTELRLFQKIILPQRLSKLSLDHVYRVEERWFALPGLSFGKMRLRFRYQLQASHPLPAPPVLGASLLALGHAEIFLQPDKGIFNQGRLSGGLGLNWRDRWRLDLSHLVTWLPLPTGSGLQGSHTLRTMLTVLL